MPGIVRLPEGCAAPVGLRLEAVHAGYGKKEVLRGLSLAVRPGEILALLGANGAGKSTLLKVVMGLLPVRQGRVWLGEQEVTRCGVGERVRLGIALMLQGGQVFPSLSVQENLEVAAAILPRTRLQAAIGSTLDLLPDVAERLGCRAGELSGGQRQTLALAMTLVRGPRVLLLDEPSAGLAPKLADELLDIVVRCCRQLGATALVVEQRLGGLLRVTDRSVWLADGALSAETATPAAWLEDDRLAYLAFERGARGEELRDGGLR